MVVIPEKFQENCDDHEGYKKGDLKKIHDYKVICGKRIFSDEEKNYNKLKDKDDTFNKKQKLRNEDLNVLLKDLQNFLDSKDPPLCRDDYKNVLDCVKHSGIIRCQPYMERFVTCVNETVKNIYEKDWQKKMNDDLF